MFLTLLTIAGVVLMIQAFNSALPGGVNATNTAQVTHYPLFTAHTLTSTSSSVTLLPFVTDSSGTTNRLKPRGHEGPGRGDMISAHTNAGGTPSFSVTSTSVTPAEAVAIPASSAITHSAMGTTFKTIFTTAAILSKDLRALTSTKYMLPKATSTQASMFRNAHAHWAGASTMVTATDSEAATASISINDNMAGLSDLPLRPVGPHSWLSVALTIHSQEGVESIASSTSEAAQETMTGGAAASTSVANVTLIISSSTDPNPVYTYGPPIPESATFEAASLTESPPSLVTYTVESATTSTRQDPAIASGESNIPDDEKGNPLFPWTPSQASPPTLTGTAIMLSVTPTQGVPTAPLTPVASSVSASEASVLATASLTSISISGLSFSAPPTHVQSVPPTTAPSSAPSSSDLQKSLSIGLGICLPIIVLTIGFIILWLWIRHVERKKKVDLEKDIIWETPPPRTPNASGTLLDMTNVDGGGGRKIEGRRASATMNPLAMNPLNEEELAIARQYGFAVDIAKAQRAGETSARSPKKTVQRRSGGANLARQWVDGANDTRTFAYNKDDAADPFHDRNAIGLAVSTNDRYRNDLHRFQPTRLSTITDKSGEVEIPDIPTTHGGAGSGRISHGGSARGRFFERFMMKRKGMMPLEG